MDFFWLLTFLAEIANRILENAQKKGVLVFGFKVLSVFFFFGGTSEKVVSVYFIFILHCNCIYCSVGVENLHVVSYTCIRFLKTLFPLGFVCFIF